MKDAVGKGLTIRRIDTMINHQTNEFFFDDLKVPARNLIGEEGQGFRYILDGMNAERILLSGEMLGDARYFIARASAYASERVVFGRPIGQNQGIQFPIARAYAEWKAADLMTRAAAALFDAGQPCGEEANTRSSWPRKRRGTRAKPACKPSAASRRRVNTTSSASGARRGSIRSRRSPPT